jgi:hypothetical protein
VSSEEQNLSAPLFFLSKFYPEMLETLTRSFQIGTLPAPDEPIANE